MAIWVGQPIVVIHNVTKNIVYRYHFKPLFSVLLHIYTVGSYGRSSFNAPPVFSIVVITFYIPTKVHKGSNFHTYILNNTFFFFFAL